MSKYSCIEENGDFKLLQENKPYKFFACTPDMHIVNTKTGKNCGTRVVLYINADGTLDEDCYQIVDNEE